MANKGNAARMKKIVAAARKIRKSNPKMKWTTAIKKGAKSSFFYYFPFTTSLIAFNLAAFGSPFVGTK